MFVAVLILLVCSLVVYFKWRNAAAKKEEILRLVAMTSAEYADIASEEYESYASRLPQLENRHHCAVCFFPTTTRCSQCKAVRYCSSKCQLVHWMQGHKGCCRPTTLSPVEKKSESLNDGASENLFENHSDDDAKTCSQSNKAGFSGTVCNMPQTTNDHSNPDVPNSKSLDSNVHSKDHNEAYRIQKTVCSKDSESFQSTSLMDKKVRRRAVEYPEKMSQPSGLIGARSISKGFGNEHFQDVNAKRSRHSNYLKTPYLDESRNAEAQICNGEGRRSVLSMSSQNYRESFSKSGDLIAFPSHFESKRMSKPTTKSLKTSASKFIQHFGTSKQPESYFFHTEDISGNTSTKLFHPKLFLQLYSSDVELHPFGLVNCGNSCYANAVLQCLTFTRPITLYLLQGLHSTTCRSSGWCFICEFECLVRKGHDMNSPLSPIGILSQVHKIGNLTRGREEDAHEFLRDVVDSMQSVCLREARVSGALDADSTILDLTFGGYLQSKVKCLKCSGKFEQYDRMLDLAVEIDGNIHTLEAALAQFSKSETLSGDDKYMCIRCKSYVKAKKKMTVFEAPNILTIVLKRFQSRSLEKLNKLVQFPEVLTLAPYMSETVDKYPIYHLYAVVVHLSTMNASYSGHYISYVKDFQGNWFRIDDSMVTPVHLETVLSSEAYILFYSRFTPRISSFSGNKSASSDSKTTRSMEAIASGKSCKQKNLKAKSSSPTSFSGNHFTDSEHQRFHSKPRNPIYGTSSDTSSVFSASDAGSYSTDSTRDLSEDDISTYFFRSTGITNIFQVS